MATLEKTCKSLLLYATEASASLENASRQMASLGKPELEHNFKEYSSMLKTAAADAFTWMDDRGYGVYFLSGTRPPWSFFNEGMSYYEYWYVIYESSKTAASPNPSSTMSLCAANGIS